MITKVPKLILLSAITYKFKSLTNSATLSPNQESTVDFATPTTGASASLTGIPLITDASGSVTTTATANDIAGDYQINATSSGLTGVDFNLTNTIDDPDPGTNPGTNPSTNPGTDPGTNPGTNPVINPGNPTSPTTTNSPDFTPIWQSVLEELPETELSNSACQTAPVIVINSTEEEEEITLDEEIETQIQRNRDCQPVVNGEQE